VNRILGATGRLLARYLTGPIRGYEPIASGSPEQFRRTLRPCDVLLVDGNTRISTAIKYLTQSTWSHAALYVGDAAGGNLPDSDPAMLVEADLLEGVRAVPLSHYERLHTRICRPVGLTRKDARRIVEAALARIGQTYDLKNFVDLVRYLLPTPPVPVRWRRRMLALGSGEPTRAICSTLIAQLFQSVGYPILPQVEERPVPRPGCEHCTQEIFHIRHHSLFAPRDFDISPYFEIVKPTLASGFDYRRLVWEAQGEASGSTRIPDTPTPM
jgi:hypothetical protein